MTHHARKLLQYTWEKTDVHMTRTVDRRLIRREARPPLATHRFDLGHWQRSGEGQSRPPRPPCQTAS